MGNAVANSCEKFLWKIVAENCCRKCCGKFLWENLVVKCCRKILGELVVGNALGNSCKKFLWEKMLTLAIFGTFFAVFKPLTGSKTLPHFYLVEEVLSFD